MAKMIRKRLVSLVIILFGLSILTFGLTYLLPSDPVEELITSMGGSHDPEIVEKLEEQYGTSRPFFVQYMDWIKGVVLHGDFGISVKYNKPVKEVIAQKLPNTVKLACTSFLTMVLIAFPLGSLGILDWTIYDCISSNHITDEVIIAEEQMIHIRERHPEAYIDTIHYVREILDDPDYIFKDKRPNTGLVVKKIFNNEENSLPVLKIITSDDNKDYKNSVITSWKITEKRLNNYLHNKEIIYKKA